MKVLYDVASKVIHGHFLNIPLVSQVISNQYVQGQEYQESVTIKSILEIGYQHQISPHETQIWDLKGPTLTQSGANPKGQQEH